ncbi:hypothetical protein [Antribacter gilvus]|uniref:hypothetical protein n=1 Tax=Antribacter gilvus TaxID=2304675 RepID=UPI000F77D021|nr:hypothetical protein [Antribacter gilvus]
MGTYFQWIADVDATTEEAPQLAAALTQQLVRRGIILRDIVDGAAYGDPGHEPGPRFLDAGKDPGWARGVDGVRVISTREAFWGAQGDCDWAECPRCSHRFDPGAERLLDSLDGWIAGEPATSSCPGCLDDVALPQWRWYENCFAFASLGLWFWQWPELGPLVTDVFREVVGSHRLVYRYGKL